MRPSPIPIFVAAVFFLVVWGAAAFHGYGWFVDELYYLACARHPAPGYIDHPPLSVLVLVPVRALFGETLWAIRLPAALAGAASVWFAARTARRLGGAAFAQTLAALLMAVAPATLLLSGFHSMNIFEFAFGAALGECLARLLVTDRPRLWIRFGVITGLALMNKHTFVVVAGSLAAAVLFTDARRHFATRWPWLGAGVAALIVLPNVWWQSNHHWISLEFYRQATVIKNLPTSPLGVLLGQLEFEGLAEMAAVLVAIVWLIRQPRLRAFAIAYLFALGSLMLSGLSRPDRIMGLYPPMFAAFGVCVERWIKSPAARSALAAGPVALALPLMPLMVPLLPPDLLERYSARLGMTPQLERGKRRAMPQWFADRFGWRELADEVSRAYQALDPVEREHTILTAEDYGVAGALEHYGPARGLPRVISAHNSYWLWGPGSFDGVTTILSVDHSRKGLDAAFESVEQVGTVHCVYCYKDGVPVWRARGLKVDIQKLWPGELSLR